jgi:hypothetical protein
VSGESVAWWGLVASLYIAAFAVLQLKKHWHRTAQFFFTLATLFAIGWLVVWSWNNADGLSGGIAFVLVVFAVGATVWFVNKVEADLYSQSLDDQREFIIRQLEGFIDEERQIRMKETLTLEGRLLVKGDIWSFRGKVEHFLALHLSDEHVARFKNRGVYALQEMIKEVLDKKP